jgi:hypothetical protein
VNIVVPIFRLHNIPNFDVLPQTAASVRIYR